MYAGPRSHAVIAHHILHTQRKYGNCGGLHPRDFFVHPRDFFSEEDCLRMRNFVLFAWRAYSCWVVPGVCPSLVFMATLFSVVFCRMYAGLCSHAVTHCIYTRARSCSRSELQVRSPYRCTRDHQNAVISNACACSILELSFFLRRTVCGCAILVARLARPLFLGCACTSDLLWCSCILFRS